MNRAQRYKYQMMANRANQPRVIAKAASKEATNKKRLLMAAIAGGLSLLLAGGIARAEETTRPAAPSAVITTQPVEKTVSATYKLGTGDVVRLEVAQMKEMNSDLLILSDGSVTLPRVGRVVVGGKTLAEAQQIVYSALSKALVNPTVILSVAKPRVEFVHVFGAVNQPGPVEFVEGLRITQALAKAGGLKFPANRVSMNLTTGQGLTKELSAEEITRRPENAVNMELHPGDLIVLTELAPQPIFVTGAVVKPGMYDLREIDAKKGKIGVLEALALTGGSAPNAALSKASILRADNPGGVSLAPVSERRREEKINLAKMRDQLETAVSANGTATADDIVLYPGDTLYIPESTAKIAVLGFVNQPGTFPISEDRPMTLLDALSMAGGLKPRAQENKIGIIRAPAPGQDATQPTILQADLKQITKKGDMSQNPILRPGDAIYVAETSKPDWLGKIIPGISSVLSTFYLGGNIFR